MDESKYQVDDRLINFYTDEHGQRRTGVNELIIKNVPPFTDDNGEVIDDKYRVFDHNKDKNNKLHNDGNIYIIKIITIKH